jgi:hypothetical protein
MNSQRRMQSVRVHLLAMARLSQRGLDYAIKGYSERHPDFSRHAQRVDQEVEERHSYLKELCRELMNDGVPASSDVRSAFAAYSIGNALHGVHAAALGIARDTSRLLESTGIQRCAALESAGRHVNAVMRLSTIALFKKDVTQALTVLQQREQLRLTDLNSVALHPHVGRWAGAQGDFERSVIRNLCEAARHSHEMADAILFWLQADTSTAASIGDLSPAMQSSVSYLPSASSPFPKISRYSC